MSRDELRELLDSLGPAEGPEAELDEDWEALALGALDDAAAARLRASAATGHRERELLELFDPLEDELVSRIADRVVALRPETPAPVVAPQGRWEVPAVEAPLPAPREPSLWARVARWLARPVVVGPLLVAAVALLVLTPAVDRDLPDYDVELRSGDRLERGADDGAVGLSHAPGSRLELVLVPERAVEQPVRVVAVLDVRGVVKELPVEVASSPEGRLQVRGRVPDDPTLPRGRAEVVLTLSTDDGAVEVVRAPIELAALPD